MKYHLSLAGSFRLWSGCLFLGSVYLEQPPLRAQDKIYLTEGSPSFDYTGTVEEYSASGVPINLNLITGLASPRGLAVSGGYIYVTETAGWNGMEKATLSGAPVNLDLVPYNPPGFGADPPLYVDVSGDDIFVLRPAGVSEYTVDGGLVNPGFDNKGLYEESEMTLWGSDLFVSNATGSVTEFTTAGVEVNPALISGLGYGTSGIAVADGHIFVGNWITGTIGEYNLDGSVVDSSLITGVPDGVFQLAAFGSDLYVGLRLGVAEYTDSGALVNADLIATGFTAQGIVVVPENISTVGLLSFSLATFAIVFALSRRGRAANWLLP